MAKTQTQNEQYAVVVQFKDKGGLKLAVTPSAAALGKIKVASGEDSEAYVNANALRLRTQAMENNIRRLGSGVNTAYFKDAVSDCESQTLGDIATALSGKLTEKVGIKDIKQHAVFHVVKYMSAEHKTVEHTMQFTWADVLNKIEANLAFNFTQVNKPTKEAAAKVAVTLNLAEALELTQPAD